MTKEQYQNKLDDLVELLADAEEERTENDSAKKYELTLRLRKQIADLKLRWKEQQKASKNESYNPTFRELLLGEDKKKDDDRNRCDKCGRVTQDPDSPLCDRCISSFNKGMSGNKTGKRKPK